MTDRNLLLRAQLLVALVYTSSAQDTDSAPQVATNGTGFPTVISTPLGVYNSSKTPSKFPWNTYNYCNAPHVNAEHYVGPPAEAELEYLNLLMRHHKVCTLSERMPAMNADRSYLEDTRQSVS